MNQIMHRFTIGTEKEESLQGCEIIKQYEKLPGIAFYLGILQLDGTITHVTGDIVQELHIDVSRAWEEAYQNVKEHSRLYKMSEILGGSDGNIPLYVVSNLEMKYGAASILDTTLLQDLKNITGHNTFVIMPSSKHEMIVTLYEPDENIDDYIDIVTTINHSSVDEDDRLADAAYLIEI